MVRERDLSHIYIYIYAINPMVRERDLSHIYIYICAINPMVRERDLSHIYIYIYMLLILWSVNVICPITFLAELHHRFLYKTFYHSMPR